MKRFKYNKAKFSSQLKAAIFAASFASTLEARGLALRDRLKPGEKNSALIGEAEILENFLGTFQNRCDIRKFGNKLSQYNTGKEQLEKFIKNPKDINSAISWNKHWNVYKK